MSDLNIKRWLFLQLAAAYFSPRKGSKYAKRLHKFVIVVASLLLVSFKKGLRKRGPFRISNYLLG